MKLREAIIEKDKDGVYLQLPLGCDDKQRFTDDREFMNAYYAHEAINQLYMQDKEIIKLKEQLKSNLSKIIDYCETQFNRWENTPYKVGYENIDVSNAYFDIQNFIENLIKEQKKMKNKELEKRIINLENKVDRFLGSQKLEPQHELKIGDKVKVVGVRNNIINNKEAVVQEIGTGIFSDMCLIKFDDEKLISSWINMSCLEPYTEPRWTFTDDEKVILRNIQKEYKWMARDKDGFLVISSEKLNKKEDCWIVDRVCAYYYFNIFNKLFQSIKFEDDEPCEFRKYI